MVAAQGLDDELFLVGFHAIGGGDVLDLVC